MKTKSFTGTIVSISMRDTVVVERIIARKHPLYKKVIRHRRRILVDTNNIQVNLGDVVKFISCRPISKNKHFKIIQNISKPK